MTKKEFHEAHKEQKLAIYELLKSCIWVLNAYESGEVKGLYSDEIAQLKKSIDLGNAILSKQKQ